jgi:transcriptional antiterminator NusG
MTNDMPNSDPNEEQPDAPQPQDDSPTPSDEENSYTRDDPQEESLGESDRISEDEPLVYPGFQWFVLRVASNKEDSVKETLLRKIKIEGMTHLVNRILVPTEKIRTMKAGKTKVQQRKLYPGYVFVEMKLEDDGRIPQDVFFLIKETTGVGDFIGTAGRPAPMQQHEVEKMVLASKAPEEEPEVKMEFRPATSSRSRKARSRTWTAPSIRCCPSRARSA